MSLDFYKDCIISEIADEVCKKISTKVVRGLQKLKGNYIQLGDDTALRNVWDEICVQVQYEYSYMWSVYEQTMFDYIKSEVDKLDRLRKQVIWLQTNEGTDWEPEDDNDDEVSYFDEDIIEYILSDYVLHIAADYTNKRIERFLESGYEFD